MRAIWRAVDHLSARESGLRYPAWLRRRVLFQPTAQSYWQVPGRVLTLLSPSAILTTVEGGSRWAAILGHDVPRPCRHGELFRKAPPRIP
jgi:hypothetical protein